MTQTELADWLCRTFGVDRTALESTLSEALERAAADWPGIRVPLDAFGRVLIELLDGVSDVEQELRSRNLSDLYFACALRANDPEALRAFDTKILTAIDGAIARVVDDPSERDEIRQNIREKLFVGQSEQPPRIIEYRGEGELRAWVAVAAVRMALNHVRSRKREQLVEPQTLSDSPLMSGDPELLAMRREVRADFEASVKLALGRLSVRQRNLLRHYFIDRLGIDEIGRLYGVHRATAARWLSQAREAVRDETRAILVDQAQLRTAEAESVMRLVDSQLEVSLGGLLGGASESE